MKIVFWGSSDFSMPALELCLTEFEVVGVVTNIDASCGRGMKEIRMTPVKNRALEKNIPCIQPCSVKDDSFFEDLKKIQADLFVVVSYGEIIPERILKLPKYESINLHASLLPFYRGASPIQGALMNGEQITGNTVQFMSKKMDQGDIILQKTHQISPVDHYPQLSEKLAVEGADLLKEAIGLIAEGKANRTPQDESKATYTKLIHRHDGRVSFRLQSAGEIIQKWKAYDSWPGIFSEYHNSDEPKSEVPECLLVAMKDIAFEKLKGTPGKILRADKNGIVIACRENAIRLNVVKPSGKKEMDAVAFFNGYKPQVGRYF